MSATGVETIPATWDDVRDNEFFRITRSLFSLGFTNGAGVPLGSYDGDQATTPYPTGIPATATAEEPTAVTTAQ